MILIGFILAAAAAVFGLDLLWKNKFKVPDPMVFGNSLGISSGRWLLVIGIIVGAAIVLGLSLLLAGLRHKRTKAVSARKDRNENRQAQKEREALQADNEHLRRQLDQQATVTSRPTTVTSVENREGATGLRPPD